MTSTAGWLLVLVTALAADGGTAAPKGQSEAGASRDAGVKPTVREHKPDKTAGGSAPAAPLPPSLTASALRQELARGGQEGSPLADQQRLENLAAELVKAREALRAETARLESILRNGGALGAGAARESGGPSGAEGGAAAPRSEARPRTASAQLEVIAKAFKGMKPEQAAAVVSQLDRGLAAEVMLRMRPADAGAVLGLLRPELGAALATEIARQPAPAKPKNAAGGAP